MEGKKLVYLDGLKGIGCLVVFLTHFVFAFYYGMYHFQPESCHLPGDLDIAIGKFSAEAISSPETGEGFFRAPENGIFV